MRLVIIITLFFVALPVNADLYKWVDEKGVTHYSNTPVIKKSDKGVEQYKETGARKEIDKKHAFYRPFDFDGFTWNIIGVNRLRAIGRQSNLQKAKNSYFLIIEAVLTNISSKPRYYGDFKLLEGSNQYPDSTTVRVYAEHQMDYPCKKSTVFEPGVKIKTYFGFDVKASDSFILLIKSWGNSKNRTKITIK